MVLGSSLTLSLSLLTLFLEVEVYRGRKETTDEVGTWVIQSPRGPRGLSKPVEGVTEYQLTLNFDQCLMRYV